MRTLLILSLLCFCALPQLAGQNFIRAYSNLPFGGTPSLLIPESAVQLGDGSYLLGAYSGYITHTQPNGEPIATFSLQKPGVAVSGALNIYSLADAGSGSFYAAGSYTSDTLYMLKANLSGAVVWQRIYVTPGNGFQKMIATQDGGLLALSNTNRGSSQGAIPVLTKLDANGNLLWQRKYFNANPNIGRIRLYDVTEAPDGSYVVTGATNYAAAQQVLVAKLSASGTVSWAKELPAGNNSNEYGVIADVLSNGQIAVAVNYPLPGTQFAFFHLDANGGNSGSAYVYSGLSSALYDGYFNSDGELVANMINSGIMFRLSSNGIPAFAYDYSAANGSFMYASRSLPVNDGGYALWAGYTYSLFGDFTPILFKTSSLGTVPSGFASPVSMTPAPYSPSLNPATLSDSSISRVTALDALLTPTTVLYDTLLGLPTALDRSLAPQPLRVYPNPASGQVTVEAPLPTGTLVINDLTGKEVFRTDMKAPTQTVGLGTVPAGRYLLRWQSGDKEQVSVLEVR